MPVRSGAQATQATKKEAPKAANTCSNTGKASARKGTYAHQTLGFGVPATSDPHHFKVVIPKANSGRVHISEYLGLQASSDEFAVLDRVALRGQPTPIVTDVAEELDRLESHLDHLRAILEQDGGIGKRLDFLAQEIFRELNTVAAKCRDSEMTQRVVEGKTLCEQIREQVQNVE